nr:AlNc14C60G4441 [Albugo laibachii Nc14]|eukprot:CCA18983.1 AlNc14C60G4441 [Albugo laibachii Nc14]
MLPDEVCGSCKGNVELSGAFAVPGVKNNDEQVCSALQIEEAFSVAFYDVNGGMIDEANNEVRSNMLEHV